jgi:hypothetical protein
MKNVFFSLAFMLIGSFAFANNSNSFNNQISNEISKLENLNLVNDVFSISTFETVKVGENLLECHVKIKGTINGKAVDMDVWFTSDSGSCIKDTVKLLKDLAADF